MAIKLRFAICMLLFPAAQLCAQSGNTEIKLSKSDKIWIAAYDDTTRALALLFIAKRNAFNRAQTINYISGSVAAAMLVTTATIMSGNDFILISIGASVLITSAASALVNFLFFSPYTIKKYEHLLAHYRQHHTIPPFYQKKLIRYLR
jgi:hypothetical protein